MGICRPLILALVFAWAFTSTAFAQDAKLSELPELVTPSNDDILYIVDDPAGTPASRKVTVENLRGAPAGDPDETANYSWTGLHTHTQTVGSPTSAGAFGATDCDANGFHGVDTTNDVPYFCANGVGSQPIGFNTLGDSFNQVTDGTNSASASGSETLKFEASSTITPTVTAGSPDKVVHAVNQAANYTFTGTLFTTTTVASLGTPTDNVFKRVTDANPDCAIGGGTDIRLCVGDGTNWQTVGDGGGGGGSSLQAVADVGRTITNAVDTSTCVKITGGGTNGWCIYTDASNRPILGTILPSDYVIPIDENQIYEVQDSLGTPVFQIDEATAKITMAKGLVSGFSVPIQTGSALLDTDDAINYVRIPFAQTITQVCAKTDQGTSTVQVQRDDGSAVNMLSSNLTAATTEACTTTFVSGENVLSEGNYINVLLVTAAASGAPERVTVSVKTERN